MRRVGQAFEGGSETTRGRSRFTLTCGSLLLALIVTAGCGAGDGTTDAPDEAANEAPTPDAPAPVVPVPDATSPRDVAVLEIEGHGTIRFELLPELAPKHVENFVKLASTDFYDGTLFHRVIPGFMVQGGDPYSKDENPNNDGRGGPGYTIDDEFSQVSFVRGIVGMARTARPNSAGSQFFLIHEDTRHLDGTYTVFGRVIEGIDVVDAITQVPIDTYGRHGPRDRPIEPVILKDVRIEKGAAGGALPEAETAPASPPAADASPAAATREEWDEG